MPNTLHEGRFLRLRDDDGWEFAERTQGTGAVCIVAVDGDHVILTSEYRSPVRATVTSLPAGLIDAAESAIEAALRELREETGYAARRIEQIAGGPISAGMSNEQMTFFLAEDLVPGAQEPVDGEDIEVHRVPLKQVSQRLKELSARGDQIDPKIFAGLYFVLSRRQTAESSHWWKDFRARVAARKASEAAKAEGLPPPLPLQAGAAGADDQARAREAARQASTEDALARLGKVLNWLGLTVGFVSGAWVLICLATLLGAFGSYTDTFGTALLAAAGVVVGFLGWLAGRTALYVLAGR